MADANLGNLARLSGHWIGVAGDTRTRIEERTESGSRIVNRLENGLIVGI